MDYNKFLQEVIQRIQEKVDGEVRVEAIKKNNSVNMDGLLIREKGRNLSPVIYLNPYYRLYLDSGDIERIADDIYGCYRKGRPADDFDISCFTDLERVKSRIVYRLVNYEKNKPLLKEVPYRKYLDLAIVFCFLVCDAGDKQASILIRNEHLAYWNVNAEEVAGMAYENTPRLLEHDFVSMRQVVDGLGKGEADREISGTDMADMPEMIILTNRSRLNGAACILYPGILKEFADKTGFNFVILPSSVHEVILVPVKEDKIPDREIICRMICEVNETEVADMEILSDHPYFYNRLTAQLSAA